MVSCSEPLKLDNMGNESKQYSGPQKLDTKKGRNKVYNTKHAKTIYRQLQGPDRA